MATFARHVDSLDLSGQQIVVALSALEGNIWDGGVGLLSVESGALQSYLPLPTGSAAIRYLGPDRVGACCDDGTLRVLSTAMDKLELVEVIAAHNDIASGVAAVPSSSQAITCGWDQNICLWDLNATQTPVTTLRNAHYGPVNACSVSPHHPQHLASVGADGMLRLWDTRVAKSSDCIALFSHSLAVSCVEWNAGNAHLLYTGTDAGEVYFLDDRRIEQGTSKALHKSRVRAIRSSSFYPDILCTCSDDTSIGVVNIAEQSLVHR